MIFNRVWAMPNKWTFTIKPIKELLLKYVGNGKGWVDMFAGENSPAEFTNDHNPQRKAKHHMEAVLFCKKLKGKYNGVLYDPPYSFRQVMEHYKIQDLKPLRTDMRFYSEVKNEIALKIKINGIAISCGWNTNGFGKCRGFEAIEILIVSHGGNKNDTLVTVERKIK